MQTTIIKVIEKLKKNPHYIKAAIIGIIIIVAFLFTLGADKEDDGISIESQGSAAEIFEKMEESETQVKTTIVVDVGGAVNNPGVIELPEGSRVYQAIEKAGGVTKDGDLKQINQAILLNDCDKLYVPSFQDSEMQATPSNNGGLGLVSNSSSGTGKININTASNEELESLNGIGPVTANKIIDYRTINGRFDAIENIMEVPGIGEKTFAGLKDSICI